MDITQECVQSNLLALKSLPLLLYWYEYNTLLQPLSHMLIQYKWLLNLCVLLHIVQRSLQESHLTAPVLPGTARRAGPPLESSLPPFAAPVERSPPACVPPYSPVLLAQPPPPATDTIPFGQDSMTIPQTPTP